MKKIKILIVDDRSSILDSISQYLEFHGFKTIKALGGEEAIKSVNKESPDLMIVDIRMSGMSGLELCKKLPKQKILFMTAFDEHDIDVEGYKNSIGLIKKPIDFTKLITLLRKRFKISDPKE